MFRRKRKATDFSAEIEAHIRIETERLREQGLSEDEAQAAARRAFGNVTTCRGTLLRIPPLALVGSSPAGRSVRPSHAAQVSGLYGGRNPYTGSWYRRQHGDF
jgi:hypothetical protein